MLSFGAGFVGVVILILGGFSGQNLPMPPEGLNMTTPGSSSARRIPQLIPHRLLRNNQRHHPAVVEEAKRRGAKFQLRLADGITAFAGSMNFVWIHAVLFAVWMVVFERNPWPTLTLVVSLEAIFLSTFVRSARTGKPPSNRPKPTTTLKQELELHTDLTRQIHVLTEELHRRLIGGSG
jgi:hypothetical protein